MELNDFVQKFVKAAESVIDGEDILETDPISELHLIKGKLGMYISKNKFRYNELPHINQHLENAYSEIERALEYVDDEGGL